MKLIQKLLINKSFRRFYQNRLALVSFCLFLLLMLSSIFANFIANDRPLIMSYNGSIYFPAAIDYLPYDLGFDGFDIDYFALELNLGPNDWMIFPPIKQRPNDQNLNFPVLPAPPGAKSIISQSQGNLEGFEVYHVLGTDTGGRDLLTRLLYGSRTSLMLALAITILSLFIGIIIGGLMGYHGGRLDLILGRILETIGYFPVLFLIIILVAFIENPSIWILVGIIGFTGFPPFAFYTRGQVLKVRKMTYVEAALALGAKSHHILFRHILPNALGPVLVLLPFTITGNISALATIDFLGFGVQPPTASLGSILRSGFEDIENRWWLVLFASIMLVVILLIVNFIGEGVRDALDPHATINKKMIKRLEENRK